MEAKASVGVPGHLVDSDSDDDSVQTPKAGRRVTIAQGEQRFHFMALGQEYTRLGRDALRYVLQKDVYAKHVVLQLVLPFSLILYALNVITVNDAPFIRAKPFKTAFQLLAWLATFVSILFYHIEGCEFGHYETCNVAFSEAYTPLFFFAIGGFIDAHTSSLQSYQDHNRSQDGKSDNDEWRKALERSKTRSVRSWYLCCFCGGRTQQPRVPVTSASAAAGGGPPAFGLGLPKMEGLVDGQMVGEEGPAFNSDIIVVDVPKQHSDLVRLYPPRQAQETANPLRAAATASTSRAARVQAVAGRSRRKSFIDALSENFQSRNGGAEYMAKQQPSAMAVAGANHVYVEESSEGGLRIAMTTRMLAQGLWSMANVTDKDEQEDCFFCGFLPVSIRRVVVAVGKLVAAILMSMLPPFLRMRSIGDLCADEVIAEAFHSCFPTQDPGCGVYDVILPPTISPDYCCTTFPSQAGNLPRFSDIDIFFGAGGDQSKVITLASAVGTAITSFLLLGKLLDVLSAYSTRFQVMTLLTNMYRGRQMSLRGCCARGCISPHPSLVLEEEPIMWCRVNIHNYQDLEVAQDIAFILTNATDAKIATAGMPALLYLLLVDGIMVVYLGVQLLVEDTVLLDNLRFEILAVTGVLLGFIVTSLLYACLANIAQASHVQVLAEQRMTCAQKIGRKTNEIKRLKAANPGAAVRGQEKRIPGLAVLLEERRQLKGTHSVLDDGVEYLSQNTRLTKFCGIVIDAPMLAKLFSVLGAGVVAQVSSLFVSKSEFPPSLVLPDAAGTDVICP